MAIGRIPEPGTGIPESIIAAKGDILTGTANDTPAVLSVGTNGHTLVADSAQATGLKYQAPTVNTVIDAEGDLLVGDTADTIQRLAIGSNAQVLTVDTAVDGKIKWATPAGGGFSGAKVFRTALINIANNTATKIAFTTEEFDTNTYHDNSTNNTRLTVPTTGYYRVNVYCYRAGQTAGLSRFSIWKNGSGANTTYFGSGAGFDTQTHSLHTILSLNANDYLELDVYQNSGGAIDFFFTTDSGYFMIESLGA